MRLRSVDLREILTAYSVQSDMPAFFVSKGMFQPPTFQVQTVLFRAGFHMVGFCIDGSLDMRINFQDYRIEPLTFISFTPTTLVQILSKSDDFRVRLLLFDQDFLMKQATNTQLLDTMGIFEHNGATSFELTPEQADQLIPLYNLIRAKYDGTDPYKKEIIRSLIFSVLYQCAGFRANEHDQIKKTSRKEEIKASFLKLVREHSKYERKTGFYANKLFITPKHLTETIRDTMGKTAGEIIDEAVAIEAKLLLNDPNKSIQSIAGELHFPDQSFFTKFFKRQTGLTPTQWRQ